MNHTSETAGAPMPERERDDGSVNIQRIPREGYPDQFCISAGGGAIWVSAHNATRILAMLSLMLGRPLVRAAQKAIKL